MNLLIKIIIIVKYYFYFIRRNTSPLFFLKIKARLLVSFCTYTLVILNKKETGVAGEPAPKNQTPYLFLYNRSSDQKIYYIKNAPYLWGLNLLPTLTVKSNQFRKSFYHVVSEKRGYVHLLKT